jgi:hypothetical protein
MFTTPSLNVREQENSLLTGVMLLHELGRDSLLRVLSGTTINALRSEEACSHVSRNGRPRNRTQACLVGQKGNEVRNHNVVNVRNLLKAELAGRRKGTLVAFEAAYGIGWVAQLLDELGLELPIDADEVDRRAARADVQRGRDGGGGIGHQAHVADGLAQR